MLLEVLKCSLSLEQFFVVTLNVLFKIFCESVMWWVRLDLNLSAHHQVSRWCQNGAIFMEQRWSAPFMLVTPWSTCIFMICMSLLKPNWYPVKWAGFSTWGKSLSPPWLCFISLWPEDSCTPRTILLTILSPELCESISTTYFSLLKLCNSFSPQMVYVPISFLSKHYTALILQLFSPSVLLL